MKISLSDLKDEIGNYSHFCLALDDALETAGIHMYYDNAAVYLSSFPCIALKNEMGRTVLKYIQSVQKQSTPNNEIRFVIRCRRYLGNEKYVYSDYELYCY